MHFTLSLAECDALPRARTEIGLESDTDRVLAKRFELRRRLGEGGMGIVYEAFDREAQALVAIKTLKAFSGESVLRFKSEFRALADLHHPNLVRLGELYSTGDHWFFTMELVRGHDLIEFVRPSVTAGNLARAERFRYTPDTPTLDVTHASQFERPEAPLDEARLRSALCQLTDALGALHETGRVHLDIKPSNVLVDGRGRVVLLDFGISRELGTKSVSDWTAGTLVYMAPEQASGHFSPAADFYALGAMLFQALTKRVPWTGSRERVLEVKRLGPPPATMGKGAPADLLLLSRALLDPIPERRPSGAVVLDVLGRSRTNRVRQPSAKFVGRDSELARLELALSEVCAPSYLCVLGDPGIGKTALVSEALSRYTRDEGALVLRGRCYERETVPYKAWDGVVDALSEWLASRTLEECAEFWPHDLSALRAVFPVLRRVSIPNSHQIDGDASWAQELAKLGGQALLDLLLKIAARRKLVLAIDDLQWADLASLELLLRLVASEARAQLIVVATARKEPPLLREQLTVGATRLTLGPLSRAAARELANSVRSDVSREYVEAACSESLGHPLHLLELCRHPFPVADAQRVKLSDALTSRIRALEPVLRTLLDILIVSGEPVALSVLARTANIDLAECQLKVQELCLRHLSVMVAARGRRAALPYHDRVREACERELYGGKSPATYSAELDGRLAQALFAEASGDQFELELPKIAFHAFRAARKQSHEELRRFALSMLLRSAKALRRTGAWQSAGEHCERALELIGAEPFVTDYESARAAYLELMELRALQHGVREANSLYELLLANSRSAQDRAPIYSAMVRLQSHFCDYPTAIAVARKALEELDYRVPVRPNPARVLKLLLSNVNALSRKTTTAIVALPECPDQRVRSMHELLFTLPPPAFVSGQNELGALSMLSIAHSSLEHGTTAFSAFGIAGTGMATSGLLFRRRRAQRIALLALALSENYSDALVASHVDMVCGAFIWPWVKPLVEARALLERALERVLKTGDRIHVGFVLAHLSINVLMSGESFKDVERLQAQLQHVVDCRDRALVASLRCPIRALQFLNSQDSAQTVSEFSERADSELHSEALGELPITLRYHHAVTKGIAFYLVGAYAQAASAFDAADAAISAGFSLPLWAEHLFYKALNYVALAFSHKPARLKATQALAVVLPLSHVWSRDCPSTFAARKLVLTGALATLWGRHDSAEANFQSALEYAELNKNRVLAALANEQLARCYARQHKQGYANDELERAAQRFERAGSLRIADRLRSELR